MLCVAGPGRERGWGRLGTQRWARQRLAFRELGRRRAGVNRAGSGGWTGLMFAAERGHRALAVLAEQGADVNATSNSGGSALRVALDQCQFLIKLLICLSW